MKLSFELDEGMIFIVCTWTWNGFILLNVLYRCWLFLNLHQSWSVPWKWNMQWCSYTSLSCWKCRQSIWEGSGAKVTWKQCRPSIRKYDIDWLMTGPMAMVSTAIRLLSSFDLIITNQQQNQVVIRSVQEGQFTKTDSLTGDEPVKKVRPKWHKRLVWKLPSNWDFV